MGTYVFLVAEPTQLHNRTFENVQGFRQTLAVRRELSDLHLLVLSHVAVDNTHGQKFGHKNILVGLLQVVYRLMCS